MFMYLRKTKTNGGRGEKAHLSGGYQSQLGGDSDSLISPPQTAVTARPVCVFFLVIATRVWDLL